MTEFKTRRRKRIAFLGGGAYTIQNYRALLNRLNDNYDIIVYFEFFYEIKHTTNFSVRVIPKFMSHYRGVREVFFALIILKDLLFKKIHLIHAHSTFPSGLWGIILGKIFHIPVIVSLDAAEASGLPEINFGDLLFPKRKKINAWVVSQANEVIVLTEFLLKEVRDNLKIDRAFHVIPRGVNISKFQYREKPISHSLKILNVSYLNPVKDQETLLRSFAIINAKIRSTLVHIGEDFNNGAVQQWVKELGLEDSVKFCGLIPNDNLPEYYYQADILLHTSRYESQAVVVNEAMACGLLVCGTHVGIMADLADRCCLTVKPKDSTGLAQIVLGLIENPEQIARLRRNAYAWSVQHDLEWTARRHEAIYEEILHNR
jgi:glycosyltransferase involved in cell wall biosynthesis